MFLYNLTIAIPVNDTPVSFNDDLLIVKRWCIFEVAISEQNKKAATAALKSVPKLPLYLL